MYEAYPLDWPADYPRSDSQKKSKFTTTLGKARDFVNAELKRLNATDAVISTNVPLKDNGDLRADWSRYKFDDTGVAVYFTRNDQQVVLCCDTYSKVWDNLHAIGRTIEALRQIDRDGVSDFLNRSFSGFKRLSEVTEALDCFQILGIHRGATLKDVRDAYRALSKKFHPDVGGSSQKFNQLYEAYLQALKYVNPLTQ